MTRLIKKLRSLHSQRSKILSQIDYAFFDLITQNPEGIMIDKKEHYWHQREWLEFRNKIFERDNYTCCHCGKKDVPLIGHHLAYVKGREIWQYPECMVLTLCTECHKKIHESRGIPVFISEELALETLAKEGYIKKIGAEDSHEQTPPAPESAVTVSVNITPQPTETTKMKRTRRLGKGRKWYLSCTAKVDKDSYDEICSIADSIGIPVSHMMRPFALLVKRLKDDISKCRDANDIENMLRVKIA